MSYYFLEPPIPISPPAKPYPFPLEALPDNIRNFVESVAKSTQVHEDMPAVISMSSLSACAQGKAQIRIIPEWTEELNLYYVVVAEPGERKSAVFSALTAPVQNFEMEYNKIHAAEFAAYRNKLNKLEAKKSSLISSDKDCENEISQIQAELLALTEKPMSELRLITTDCTAEAITAIMHANNDKIAVLSDEGVFDVMAGLYSNGRANINIYLNSYDGKTISIDRKSSGNLLIRRPLITFGICCQPSVINDFIADKRFIGKGLAQRFLYSKPPSLCGSRRLYTSPIDINIRNSYYSVINKILSLPDSTDCISISEEALSEFNTYFNEIENLIGTLGSYDVNRTFLSKLLGKTARICGLLHLCNHEINEPVSKTTMQSAISIARYFQTQNDLIFNTSEEYSISEYVIDRITATSRKNGTTSFRARDIKRFCQKYRTNQLDEALLILEEHNYLHFTPDNLKNPDRRQGIYDINPYILHDCQPPVNPLSIP